MILMNMMFSLFRHHSVSFPRNKSVTKKDLSLVLRSDYLSVKETERAIATLVWLSITKSLGL